MKLVTVYKAWSTEEAALVRSRLEAAQFHPMIVNENTGREMLGGLGGTIVQVPEEELADATEFLTSSEETGSAPAE